MSDIFISYAREDLSRAEQLAHAFEAQGWSVFWDRDAPSGQTWRTFVGKALDEARCVVAAWSAASIESHWVHEEADEGRRRRILIPVLFESVIPPIGFRTVRTADLAGWDGTPTSDVLGPLVTEVAALLSSSPRLEEERSRAEAAAPRRAKQSWLKPASFVGLSAIALVAGWQCRPSDPPAGAFIEDFRASATSIAEGEEVTLTWSTSETDRVELTPQGAVPQSGSTAVSPEEDTEYVLTAFGPAGSDERSIRIEVATAEPEIAEFRGDATSITEGDEVMLTWSTSDATRVELRTGDPVALSGSTAVSPQQTTDYILVAFGPGGETWRSVRISVAPPVSVPTTANLSAEPSTIEFGGSSTLRWSTTNASSVRLADVGPVEASGFLRVTPTESTTYRLLVTGSGGTIQREVEVTLTAPATPIPPPGADDPLNRPIWIEGGTFQMGSNDGDSDERPLHRVTVPGFWIQEHEVTNEEYRRFDPEHQFPSGQERHPAVQLTWQQAMDYAASRGGSLPTEAQWEFAARGAEGRAYPWGEATPTCQLAQYEDCDPGATITVMSRPDGATPEGVHDLAGNVWEWVRDWYGPYEATETLDPTGARSGSSRVMRGGSFSGQAANLRAPYRLGVYAEVAFDFVGARVAWVPAR